MKIYLDILFIQNTIILFCILFIFCKLINIKVSLLRLISICCLQSLFNILILILLPKLYLDFYFQTLEIFLIMKFGLRQKFSLNFIFQILALWIAVICFGGIAIKNNGNLGVGVFVFLLVGGIALLIKNKEKNKLLLESTTCNIEFNYNNVLYKMRAFIDTGNKVKTLFGEHVIFVREELLNIDGGDFFRRRTVKYRTISGTSTNIGVKVNNINISYGDKKINKDATIITTNNISDDFEAIIGFDLLEGGYKNGNYAYDKTKSEKTFFEFFNNTGIK